MRVFALIGFLAASTCWAHEPPAIPQPLNQVQTQAPAAAPAQTITIPAGTQIQLSLASPISYKAARPGTAVRAITGFPVTVGNQLAIPVGTYVEGVIDKATRKGRSGASLQIHFTRILFANGYSVPINATSTQAEAITPGVSSSETYALVDETGENQALAAQQSPEPSPLPKPPSHIGLAIGLGVGGAVAGIVTAIIFAHHAVGGDVVLFDAGWQCQMVLQSPLTVDAASIAATAPPSAQ